MKIVAQNKKAYHDYFILESYEAGIELKGTEIKSVRKGSANLKDSYVRIKNGEAFVVNMHIAPYEYQIAKNNPEICIKEGGYEEGLGGMPFNPGLFALLLQRGDIKAICCGHTSCQKRLFHLCLVRHDLSCRKRNSGQKSAVSRRRAFSAAILML